MQQIMNQVSQIGHQLASVIWQVSQFVWNWSFGQVAHMLHLTFKYLPLWTQLVYVLVMAAIAYVLYKIAEMLIKAVQCALRARDMQSVLSATVGFFSALAAMRRKAILVGLIAFGGAWIINNLNPSWMPAMLR